jgi:hypothetical protein
LNRFGGIDRLEDGVSLDLLFGLLAGTAEQRQDDYRRDPAEGMELGAEKHGRNHA